MERHVVGATRDRHLGEHLMLAPVDIAQGQVSGVDSLASAPSSVLNWEVDDAGINRPRPGLATYSASGTGFAASPVIGLARWQNYVVFVTTDRKLWAISDANPTLVQALSDSTTATQLEGTTRPVFALGEGYVYVTGGGRIQRWTPSLGLSSVLSSSPICTHVCSIGQRLVTNISNDITLSGTFQWSDIGEGAWTTWPAANTANAEARPDPIVAVTENTSEMYVMGSETLQAYGIGSDPTFPFEQISTVNVGLAAPYAFVRMDDQIALLDSRRRIVISDGRSANPISDAIQKDLRGLTTISDGWMFREERGQQSLLVARFPTERRTFVYDLRAQRWTERDYYAVPFHADFPVGAHAYWPTQNANLFGSSLAAGGLLKLDDTSRQDIAGPLVCERTTGWQDFGTANRKRSARLRLVMRRGTAAQGATPGALELRAQQDDGPWSTWKQISVGTPEQYQQVLDVFALNAIFRRRRYGIRYSSSDDVSLVSVHDDITDLGSA
jgi:hypothetical protein